MANYQCNLCDATFNRNYHLKRHLRTKHSETKPSFICDICTYSFSRADTLKAHRKSHFDDVSHKSFFQCTICDKTFRRVYHLKRHQRTVHRTRSNDEQSPVQEDRSKDRRISTEDKC